MIFVADAMNRKVKALSCVPSSPNDDGPGEGAQWECPTSLVCLAGQGGPGASDGRGCEARFNQPVAVAAGPGADGRGRLWVLDRTWGTARLALLTEDASSYTRAAAGRWSAPGIAEHTVVVSPPTWADKGMSELRKHPPSAEACNGMIWSPRSFMTKPNGLAMGMDGELLVVETGEKSGIYKVVTASSQRFRLLKAAQRCALGRSLHARCGAAPCALSGLPFAVLHEQIARELAQLVGTHCSDWDARFVSAAARWGTCQ